MGEIGELDRLPAGSTDEWMDESSRVSARSAGAIGPEAARLPSVSRARVVCNPPISVVGLVSGGGRFKGPLGPRAEIAVRGRAQRCRRAVVPVPPVMPSTLDRTAGRSDAASAPAAGTTTVTGADLAQGTQSLHRRSGQQNVAARDSSTAQGQERHENRCLFQAGQMRNAQESGL